MPSLVAKLAPPLTQRQKLRIRAMYVAGEANLSQIARKVGANERQVRNFAHRNRLAGLRRSAVQKAQLSINAGAGRLSAAYREEIDTFAARLPAAAHRGLDLAESSDDGKEYGMAVGGACKAIETYRRITGVEAAEKSAGQSRAQVLSVIVSAPLPAPEQRAIEVPVGEVLEFA